MIKLLSTVAVIAAMSVPAFAADMTIDMLDKKTKNYTGNPETKHNNYNIPIQKNETT